MNYFLIYCCLVVHVNEGHSTSFSVIILALLTFKEHPYTQSKVEMVKSGEKLVGKSIIVVVELRGMPRLWHAIEATNSDKRTELVSEQPKHSSMPAQK